MLTVFVEKDEVRLLDGQWDRTAGGKWPGMVTWLSEKGVKVTGTPAKFERASGVKAKNWKSSLRYVLVCCE